MRSAISRIAIVLLTVAMCFGCQKRSGIEALVDKVMVEAGANVGELAGAGQPAAVRPSAEIQS